MAYPLPPGPTFLEAASLLAARRKSVLGFYRQMATGYGDVSFLKLGALRLCFLNSADAVKTVTSDHASLYAKGSAGYQRLRPIVGNGLLTSEGEFWRRQRRLASPAFHQASLKAQTPLILETVQAWVKEKLEELQKQGTPLKLDLAPEMSRLSLRISARVLFGASTTEMESVVVDAATKLLRIWGEKAVDWLRIIDLLLPVGRDAQLSLRIRRGLGGTRAFDDALASLETIVTDLIRSKRQATEARPDVLTLLIRALDDETRDGMTDRQLRDEVMTLLIAGYETTATALIWSFYLLDRNPTWVDRGLADPEALERIIQESLRLYPPIWRYSREAQQEDSVAGFRIPKGTVTVISPYFIHRNPKYWPNPEAFDPDRFMSDAERPKFSYVPFGSGPRTCIGGSLATTTLQIVLSEILRDFVIRVERPDPIPMTADLTLKPEGGLPVSIERRR